MHCVPVMLLFVCGIGVAPAAAAEEVRNVVIVIMGGVRRGDTIDHPHRLYIDQFWNHVRPHGTLVTDVRNLGQTFPIPSQAALLTGRWMTFDPPERSSAPPAFPTLFEYWRGARGQPETGCVYVVGKPRLGILAHSTHAAYGAPLAPTLIAHTPEPTVHENVVYERFVAWFTEHKPSLVVLALGSGEPIGQHAREEECVTAPQVDACGGEASLNMYFESIILMDSIILDLWHRVQEDAAYRDSTLFVVTGDHGRHSRDYSSYGDQCPGCSRTFMFFAGPGVRRNTVSRRRRTLIDLCPTVGFAAGVATPHAQGAVMHELFGK